LLNKKINIAVCFHKEAPYIKSEYIQPVQVGAALSNKKLDFCVQDDDGENISAKNKSWCELTALYWQWKNVHAEYYGLFHYRRYLSFNPEPSGSYQDHLPDAEFVRRHSLSDIEIERFCQKYDIITAPNWSIHPVGLPNKIMSSYEFYAKSHHSKDLDSVLEIIKFKFPEFYIPTLESIYSNVAFFGNVQIMKSEYFQEYCKFLFGVLEEAEKAIDISKYDHYQKRIWGFIAERLANAYLNYAQKKYKNLRATTAPMILLSFFDERKITSSVDKLQRKSKQNNLDFLAPDTINVCFSFDDNYLPHADVAITTLIQNTSSKNKLNIYLLCDERLSPISRTIIQRNRPENVSILFIDVDAAHLSGLPLNRSYISINTYYRLAIQRLLPHIDKIIYLDSDILVLGDIAELWLTSMDEFHIAGVQDEGGVMQSRRLNLNPENSYVNAGVLVFNLEKIRRDYPDILTIYFENFYRRKDEITLQDQDILNLTFEGSCKILPIRWNINSRIFRPNFLDYKYSDTDAIESICNPGIIHFTDAKKPWKLGCNHPLRYIYWSTRKARYVLPITIWEKFVKSFGHFFQFEINGDFVSFRLLGRSRWIRKKYLRPIAKTLKFIR
jgi:lipopolysaccharide biosynthesis glycosyltransferase